MEAQIEMEMRDTEDKGGVHDRPVDPHDVGEDVWIIRSNKSHQPLEGLQSLALFNLEIVRHVGPSSWDQAKHSFCALPQWKQQECRGSRTGSCGKEA